ncbi:MAG: hypothetical protein JXR77_12000 [Lentisphaeria bacterium]|nr:hypothetical protein [Lentisphaeria bacterium]
MVPKSLLALLACAAVATPPARARSIDLGGNWLTLRLPQPEFPPADAPGWTEHDVVAPVGAAEWICQRRAFPVPADAAGKRLFLRFEGVKYTARVRCNGNPVGQHTGGYEPFECDITACARIGAENTVEVLAGSWKQLAADPEAYAPARLDRDGMESLADQLLYPVGSHTSSMGIWAPVSLEVRDDLFLEDVVILPSVRRKSLDVRFTVRNLAKTRFDFRLQPLVTEDARRLLEFPVLHGSVQGEDRVTLTARTAWERPPLWWPHKPQLLYLETALRRGDAVLDQRRDRFGFREVWTEGERFVLNGVPLHLLGNSCHPLGSTREKATETYRLCREAHVNCFRLHAQPWGKAWYDVADETGMLIIHESAVWCFVRQYALADPRFWDNFATHLRAQIRLHRNRPSVIGWSIENEMLHCGGTRVEGTEQRLADLASVVRDEDPTRLISYDGDEDPMGAADVSNLHYAHSFPRNRLWPDTCYWFDHPYKVQGWPRREWQWDRRKPLYIGEYLWQPGATPDSYSLFFGDEAYTDMRGFQIRAKATAWRYQIEAYRAQGLSGGCPWNIFEGGSLPDSPMYRAVQTAYRPQCVLVRQWSDTFFPAQTFRRDLTVINDVLRSAHLTLKAWLQNGAARLSEQTQVLEMEPAEIRCLTWTFAAPDAPEDTSFQLVTTLEEYGREVFRETRPCRALPAPAGPGVAAAGTVLFDPSGSTHAALRECGCPVPALAPGDPLPDGTRAVIVGEGALEDPPDWPAGGQLREFAGKGGRVIVLAQTRVPPILPASLHQDGSTHAFLRDPGHPLTDGIPDDAFRLWEPDHLVSRCDLERPDKGAAHILVDAGGNGLDRVLLMELPYGGGAFLFCQALVVEKCRVSPVAARLLRRLVDYAATPTARRGPLAIACRDTGVTNALRQVGVIVKELDWTVLGPPGVTLVDGERDLTDPEIATLRTWVEKGGTLWLNRPAPALVQRFGIPLPGYEWTENRGAPLLLNKGTPLARGLRNEDLYWLGDDLPKRHAAWGLTPDVITHALTPVLSDAVRIEIPPAALDNSTVPISRREQGGIWLSTRGTLTTDADLPRDGTYILVVNAGGTPFAKVFPAFRVLLDDMAVGGFQTTAGEPHPYTVAFAAKAGKHRLGIAFTNDASGAGEDRNAFVAGAVLAPSAPLPDHVSPVTSPPALVTLAMGKGTILLDGIRWHDPGARNVGKARRFLSALLTRLAVETLPVNRGVPLVLDSFTFQPGVTHLERRGAGQLYLGNTGWTEGPVRFDRDGPFEVIIEAQGTEAKGEFPEIEIFLDGTPVGRQFLPGSGWQDLTFPLPARAGEHLLRVRFTNDFHDPAAHLDRNLWIKRIAVAAPTDP